MSAVEYANPFQGNIVLTPWEPLEADVTEIHARAFEQCLQLVAAVGAQGQSGEPPVARVGKRSLLLHGAAGSGKTHLLARLCHHLVARAPASGPPVVFAWVRLNAGAGRLWRHVRREFVEDLLDNPRDGDNQLRRVLEFHVPGFHPPERPRRGGEGFRDWLGRVLGGNRRADQQTVAYHDLARRAGLSTAVRDALPHVYGDDFLDVRDWLRGGRLPHARLAALGLAGAGGGEADAAEPEEAQEERAREVVAELCRLAGPRVPVVFAFDQIEALGAAADPEPALQEFGRLVSALHDLAPNAVLITCAQSSHLPLLQRAVRGADWDRLAGGEATLQLFGAPEAMALIRRRMAGVDVPERKERQAKGEADWPFSEEAVRERLSEGAVTARELLGWAAGVFDRAVNKRQPARGTTAEFLTGNWVERLRIARTGQAPRHGDTVYRQALPLLASLWPDGPQLNETSPLLERLTEVDMVFETADGSERVGVCLCNQNSRWLPVKLEALRRQWDPKQLHRLVLLRDEGWALGRRADRTNEQLAALKDARLLGFSAEELTALQVFSDLVRSAESLGLFNGDRPVTADEVRRWVREEVEAGRMRDLEKARSVFGYGSLPGRKPEAAPAPPG